VRGVLFQAEHDDRTYVYDGSGGYFLCCEDAAAYYAGLRKVSKAEGRCDWTFGCIQDQREAWSPLEHYSIVWGGGHDLTK
jgi:hypothetical protein